MTDRVYWRDSYRQVLSARVRRVCSDSDGTWVALDRTLFFPGGGGQPADHGTLDGMPLLGLREQEGEVWHGLVAPPKNRRVELWLDFSRRYDHMQQHTAQHLLSQVCQRQLAAGTLSFALGADHTTIEIDRPELTAAEAAELERECLKEIAAHRRVRIYQSDHPEDVPFRRPPKVAGRVRVVEIDGLDHSACAGTHACNTAEIGWVKIVTTDRVRGHVRIHFVAGFRALADHARSLDTLGNLGKMLSSGSLEIVSSVERIVAERDHLARELRAMSNRAVAREVREALADPAPLVVREWNGWEPSNQQRFVAEVMAAGRNVVVFDRARGGLLVGRGQGALDLRELAPRIYGWIGGRGGGRPDLVSGRGDDFAALDDLLDFLTGEFSRG